MNITILLSSNSLFEETVSSSIINLLYDIAINPNSTDNIVNLSGKITCNKGYLSKADALHTAYPDLYISIINSYIAFTDPVVENTLKSYGIGDGDGITLSDAQSATTLYTWTGNTLITSFNEFRYFTNWKAIPADCFNGCSQLQSIDLSNVTSISDGAFQDCSSLNIDLLLPNYTDNQLRQGAFLRSGIRSISNLSSSITSLEKRFSTNGGGCFLGCTNLVTADLSDTSLSVFGGDAFVDCTSLTTIICPSTITKIGTVCGGCTSLQTLYFPVATPPTITSEWVFKRVPSSMTVYVPVESVLAYQQAAYWSNFNIQPVTAYTTT